MKRISISLACAAALFLTSCSGESQFPSPTGKGAIRMVNALQDGPTVALLIEETIMGAAGYKDSTQPTAYDDFEYNFNFETSYPGRVFPTRVATQLLNVEREVDYTFLLTGDVSDPTITVWTAARRRFEDAETVFEMRFSHASYTLLDVDVYFDSVGTALGTNAPVATLSPGQATAAMDFEAGDYVLTVTAVGDIGTIHFTSTDTALAARFAHLTTLFDGDGNDTAPYTARSMTAFGDPHIWPDRTYPPITRFIHGAYTLETVDVYNDELLTELFVDNLPFTGYTSDIETTEDLELYFYTPADSTATVLFEQEAGSQDAGTFAHIYLIGDTDAWRAIRSRPERSASSIAVKLRLFQASFNQQSFDMYLKDRGDPLVEEDVPVLAGAYPFNTGILRMEAGNFDIHLTEPGTKIEISAVFEIDVVLGDIVDLLVVDTVSPTMVEIHSIPVP